ncbi:MAG: hypothetical protein ABSC06_37305 [Rhodopila sp.]|jgi:hypothetical protein
MVKLDESSFHRDVGYSISDLGNGKWQWKLHPKLKPGSEVASIISGEISGTHDEAVVAAKAAIDTHID